MAKETAITMPETVLIEPGLAIVKDSENKAIIQLVPPPPPQNAPPTEAQQAWMRNNPRYVRMSHGLSLATYIEQGTLRADGAFIPAILMPVHDGNGDFGVGIPTRRR